MTQLADRYGGAALVTGASAGIGEAIAIALASEGFDLVLVARRQERLEVLATKLRQIHGVSVLVLAEDLAEPGVGARLADRTREAGVEVGLLVNNAGFGLYGPLAAQDPEQGLRMVDVNCRAVLDLTYAFLPQLLDRGRGALIFVASIAAFQPAPFRAVYAATKAFDLQLAEALWAELGPKGIDVLALCPGYTPTEFQAVASAPERKIASSAEEVATAALEALGNKPTVIPGVVNKLGVWSTRLLPRETVLWAVHRYSVPTDE